jgi:DNA polymerase-3 subunit delta
LIIQTIEDLKHFLRSEGAGNLYLVLGPELYLTRQAVDLLKNKWVSPESASFDYAEFTAGTVAVDEIFKTANTFPMIAKKRFVLVADAEKLKDAEQEELLASLHTLSSRSVLVLLAEDLDHRKRFYKAFRENYTIAEFPKLKGGALEQWADAYLQRRGYRCTRQSVKQIVDLAGADLQTLVAELEKLLLYAGSEKTISDAAVAELIGTSRQQGIFDFIDAVAARDRNAALRSLANLVGMGEHPLVVVTMLARHCRQVLIAKELMEQGIAAREIGVAAQIPAFKLPIFLRQARAIAGETIQQMYIRLADIDRKLKSSPADGRLLLENLICALI